MSEQTTAIVWFRRDLRLADNPALSRAVETCGRIVPVYVHAPQEAGDWAPGAASRWWLHHSLLSLDESLRGLGSRLVVRQGDSLSTLRQVIDEAGATHVFWNRMYEPHFIDRDKGIKETLRSDGLTVESFNGSLLFEPGSLLKDDGTPYRVFTPFWKACVRKGPDTRQCARPPALPEVPRSVGAESVDSLELLPRIRWDTGLGKTWRIGEPAAAGRLQSFLEEGAASYPKDRNRPDLAGTSRLSPHLHFGEISPRQVVAASDGFVHEHAGHGITKGVESFVREVGWREFAYHLLFHFPETASEPLDTRFARFPWAERYGDALDAWQRGRTGIPIVDAGMRELWHTGWMHNRVRMVVASLLTKNLLIPWQEGTRWFWDTLVDADLANNTLGWQWTAGCGADAAPFFRIFNPVLQGEKFDPGGEYVRRWVPEIARLPDRYLNKPWEAPGAVLDESGLKLGRDYPEPIVDLRFSRQRALERFEGVKTYAR